MALKNLEWGGVPLLATSKVTELYEILYEGIFKNRKSKEMIHCIIISLLISSERGNVLD